MNKTTFTKAKKNRNELQLPILHFVAADDWIDTIGPDAFAAWLKFYSWCDRSDDRKDLENDVIPSSLSKIMARLGVGKKKFYNQIIRPLWNHGLIDLIEYNESTQAGNKPMNIVVYEYPQNDINKKYQPLEMIRDYDHDYQTESRTFAKTGGRNGNKSSGGFTGKPGVVSNRNRGWFPDETGGGFSQKHNNGSNSNTNVSKYIYNDSNNISNLSISENMKRFLDKQDLTKEQIQAIEEHDRWIDEGSYMAIIKAVLRRKHKIKDFNGYLLQAIRNFQQEAAKPIQEQKQADEVLPDWFNQPADHGHLPKDQKGKTDTEELKRRIQALSK